jgi:hypothetical protein
VQERLLRTQAKIVAIEAALAEGPPERRWDVDPDGFPLDLPADVQPAAPRVAATV